MISYCGHIHLPAKSRPIPAARAKPSPPRELISCILVTGNRPRFFEQAIHCFLAQTYRPAELIVVDDGDQSVEDLCSGLAGVHYMRLGRPASAGAKLNLAIENAKGAILQKLDDDDYYHPNFLKLAAKSMPRNGRDKCLVAWDCFLTLRAGEEKARFSGHGWTVGGTLCFSRKLWERRKFRNVRSGPDYWFLSDNQPKVIPVCAAEHYLVVRHGRNTWTRMQGDKVDDCFRKLPVYPKPLDELVSPRAYAFYRSLKYDGD